MEHLKWDGPADNDEELAEFIPFKNDYEKQMGIKYSKNGIMKFIEDLVKKENRNNKEDVMNARLWEEKLNLKNEGLIMYVKKGGSHLNQDQPFLRTEVAWPAHYKMENLIDIVSSFTRIYIFIIF